MMNKPAKLAIENVILSDPVSIPQGAYQFKQNNGIFAKGMTAKGNLKYTEHFQQTL